VNFLDRAIAIISPTRGMRRAAAREALRHYKAAGGSLRSGSQWRRDASANDALKGKLKPTRARARDMARNNALAQRIITVMTTALVGTGIAARSNTGSASVDRRLTAEFKAWAKNCDVEGRYSFDAVVALACRAMIESGEALVLPRIIKKNAGGSSFKLQVVEADYLDDDKQQQNTSLGVEFSDQGERLAYWLKPVVNGSSQAQSKSVAADKVIHLFHPLRPGQIRGVTWLAPVVETLDDLADFKEAALVKAKIEACFAVLIESTGIDTDPVGINQSTAQNGRPLEELSPGMIRYLKGGEKATFAQPTASANHEPFVRSAKLDIASGTGVPYAALSSDQSQSNYTSNRSAALTFNAAERFDV
jgi:lambda family phage portal protein